MLRKTHVLCNRVRYGSSRSSKVVDFGTNRKRLCDFLSLSCTISEIRRPFGRKTPIFLSHSHLAPSDGVNPFEFLDEPYIAKTRVLGLCVDKDFLILLTQCHNVTDRQTDKSTVADTGLCIASCADAL